MNSRERILQAIDKLTAAKNGFFLAEDDLTPFMLHRTIDAQIDILRAELLNPLQTKDQVIAFEYGPVMRLAKSIVDTEAEDAS